MSFPTIPTVAAGRVLSNTQANTTATRTFPALSGLTKNSGDLLIAIIVGYQTGTGTNAAFSAWSDGFTEFGDFATTTNLALGCAYKWSDGTESAAPTVTQAGTITGHAAMMLLSIPGAHATTPPEAGSSNFTTAATMANPPAFNPAGWDIEETLWISVGADGETSLTGSYTGLATAPTNYTNTVLGSISADAIGGVHLGVAFRQLSAASEDVGTWAADTSNSRHGAFVIAVRPAPLTAPGIPTSVVATLDIFDVDLSWTAPGGDGGSPITDYAVRYSSNAGGSWSDYTDGVSTLTTATAVDLPDGTYIFQVAAINAIGQGAWSASSNSVIVDTWQTFADGTLGSTGATVTGLTNGIAYEFRVAAVNAEGQSAWSNIAGPYTPALLSILKLKAAGVFTTELFKTKVGGAFVTKTLKTKVGGTFIP